nr:immunoglobulin heavy chain junction region [Macaca mulatta]MOX59108.1 immunoglobulin heavy chain junction region [Macaca mulatta]MOX59596.1 immunoglobulin heavy chain junction region [Macaca mulatta]MOX61312.1 immunoglobulin heavy chain junction region [Macaca mulatta]MOX62553.1 immunoglobulin heavy chain junction region [Macaca mulatta]
CASGGFEDDNGHYYTTLTFHEW